MVDRMLDLVANDLEGPGFVDKTFLEPSAGDGNFLVAILQRKLAAVERTIEPELWTQESLFALASIYGIELLEDNHADAKAAMLEEFLDFHGRHGSACHAGTDLQRAARYLITPNIVRGNTLTALDEEGRELLFSWWNRVPAVPGAVQREIFRFASMREDSMFDFANYDTYAVCQISQVHHEMRTDA